MIDRDDLDPPRLTAEVDTTPGRRRRRVVEVVRDGRRQLVEVDPLEAGRFDRELSSVRRTLRVT